MNVPAIVQSSARGAQVFFQESPNAAFTLFQSPFHITPGAQGIPAVPNGASGMIKITQHGSQPSMDGAAANFTGIVRVDALFQAPMPARVGGATVTFAPGARTVWHSHPLGQTLHVVAGTGLVQQWGQAVQTIRPGDLVWIPPNTKHWHGATATSTMVHIAITEALDGKAADWMEPVNTDQYGGVSGCSRRAYRVPTLRLE